MASAPPATETSEVTIPPIPADLVGAELKTWANTAGVALEPVEAIWWHRGRLHDVLAEVRGGTRCGLQFHGGGYVIGSARDVHSGGSRIPRGLVEHGICSCVLALDYTLVSANEEDRVTSFPLQILEALSALHHLTYTLKIPPSQIVLVGDSAGGHLALALQRYLLQSNAAYLPGGLILLSPWCDLSVEGHRPHVQRLLGCRPAEDLASPYFSPALHDFPSRWPPTIVYYGANESFAQSIATLVSRLAEGMGDARVTAYPAAEDIPEIYSHDFLLFLIVHSAWPAVVQECWMRLKAWSEGLDTTSTTDRI